MAVGQATESLPSHLQGSEAVAQTKSELIAEEANEKGSTGNGTENEIYVDPVIEKKVLRRLDKRFAPLFCALYFFGAYFNIIRKRKRRR